MRDWRDVEEGPSSWRSHGSRENPRAMERRRSADEGYDGLYDVPVSSRAYEYPSGARYEPLPTLQPRVTPDSRLGHGSLFASSSHYGDDNAHVSAPSHLVRDNPHLLRPPPHYPDSHYGRHHSAPLHGSEDRSRTASSSSLPFPGALQDGAPSSKVVLPPMSHLLGTLGSMGHDNYDQGTVLPRLRLLDRTAEFGPPPGDDDDRADIGGSPEAAFSPSASHPRGKKRRTDTTREAGEGVAEERKTKVPRKIYVACDFCRGRKLRCDGSKPCCSNCATRSLACQYQDHPRRRGPGKAPKGSRTKKSEAKGRKGNKTAKEADSQAQFDMAGSPSRFDPALALPEDDRPCPYSELRATYAPRPYTDRPSASNAHHAQDGPDPVPYYQFSGDAFNTPPEYYGSPKLSRRNEAHQKNGTFTESAYLWPPEPKRRDEPDTEEGPPS
ncbi:hypothetical protein HYDPIDRAFT_168998 [Hydnomerulius pinastri MD-312]|uniref:Zn(2)-C6 fungal-type domain-containing protein n=1 Tax=Hydnomerulius pinastri MD-312 TaxID=994086 RepID=A0A0C9VWT5_9AGAM|nr:hypothetical protein HYDPIDRAFT_168998 [Hydnomerulius pinastri MD-312]